MTDPAAAESSQYTLHGCREARSIGRASCLQGPFIDDNAQQQEAGHSATWTCRRDDVDGAIVVARHGGAGAVGVDYRELRLRCIDRTADIPATSQNYFDRLAPLVSDRNDPVRGDSDSRPGYTAVARFSAKSSHYVAAARCDDRDRYARDADADSSDAGRIVRLCSDMGGTCR